MPSPRAAVAAVFVVCLLLASQISQAQSATTLDAETGNDTPACSGLSDPLGNHTYCTGNLIGFSTASTNTHTQTQLVDAIAGHMSTLPLSTWLPAGPSTKFIAPYQPWFCTAGGGSGPYNGSPLQFCNIPSSGGHEVVGYDESTAQVVAAQHNQMVSLGYWAVSPDWYGINQAHTFLNLTVQAEAADLSARSGYPLKLLIMIDQGAILSGTQTLNGCPQDYNNETGCITQNLEADIDYIDQNWAENPYYAQDSTSGANLVSVFIDECAWPSIHADCPGQQTNGSTDWDSIWQSVTQHTSIYKTPMVFVKEYGSFDTNADPNPFDTSYFSGAYAWPQIAGPNASGQYYVDSNNGGWTFPAIPSVAGDCSGQNVPGCMQFYWNQTASPTGNGTYQYLVSFYNDAQGSHSSKIVFGEILKGFDNSNAYTWHSPEKIIAQQCGQVLVYSANATNTAWGLGNPPRYVQTPTWNDYEEGTEVETGVDNCWRVQNASYDRGNDRLTWQLTAVSGQASYADLSTVNGYTVWAVTNHASTNPILQFVTNVSKETTYLNNVSTLIHGSFSQLYVEMVGMPLILNQMSNAANY